MAKRLKKICCEICGNSNSEILHKHHVIERTKKNTSNDAWNLAILCPNCHFSQHSGLINIIDIFPSTQQPYNRTVVYIKDGNCNIPELSERYKNG